MQDAQYRELPYTPATRPHRYGTNVHLLSDPYLITRLARICSPSCTQPEFNEILKELYRSLARIVANTVFPRVVSEVPTRMAQDHPEATYHGQVISPETSVVIVDLARAGMLPSFELFQTYSTLLEPGRARMDHIFINRAVDEGKRVIGAPIHGSKIGGPVDSAIVILPDPMGATGNSVSNVIQHYKDSVPGKPSRWLAINLIVTPEYIRKITKDHPDVTIYALRLDRAFSSARALAAVPGTYWDEEKGLNDHQYIVPGGGGFGELSSNAYV